MDHFVHGFFHILVPQTVDHGIQHGDHCGVKHGYHFPLLHRLLCGTSEIHEYESPVKYDDSCQMGPTGRKGLPPAIRRVHS